MKNTNTEEKILELLFEYPTKEFHIRELSRILDISPPAISKAVKNLNKQNIVIVEKNILHNVKANLNNENFKHLKRVENIKRIYSSGLFNYIRGSFPLATIILFGSYSKGEDTERSDIDIAILNFKERKMNLEKYEEILKRKINIEFINMKNITKELKNSIINGIVLSGYIEI